MSIALYPAASKGAELIPVSDAFVFGLPFIMDATLSEQWSGSVTWTRNPLEDGTVVTDHGVVEPPELQITGWVTETPMDSFDELPARLTTLADALMDLLHAKQTCIVTTGLRVYVDYVVSSVSISRSPEQGRAATVSVSLIKLNRVSALETLIPPELLAPPVEPGAQPRTEAGAQAPADESVSTEDLAESEEALTVTIRDAAVDFDAADLLEAP